MDSFSYAGNCALHTTVQASNLQEAKYLYDQFAIITPFLSGLTGASPFVNGKICDFDCRWLLGGALSDDRTEKEIKNGDLKPRYGTNCNFISDLSQFNINDD